jgi:hypothetical protein
VEAIHTSFDEENQICYKKNIEMASEHIDNVIKTATEKLNPKQKKVLTKRFGLMGSGITYTLQNIGNDLGVTRERVRQIENQAIQKIKNAIRGEAATLIQAAGELLAKAGGAEEGEKLIGTVGKNTGVPTQKKVNRNKIKFIFIAAGAPKHYKENPTTKSFWYSSEQHRNQVLGIIKNAKEEFARRGSHVPFENSPEHQTLLISKNFSINAFGDLGLTSWPEIKPKNIRDKAYLAIKKHGKPIHFEEIATQIARTGISQKPVNTQTVHNELIKDSRFVLVGRGIYGLQEQGYKSGTVRKLIKELIEKHGPQNADQIVSRISKQRILRENTILLNLQSKKHFTRDAHGRYNIKDA